MSKYQVMPPLSDEQYEALKADIATAGVRVPIEVDEHGEVIDGHHRRAIAMELGIECPEVVVRGLEEFEKLDRAFVLNATRRHFNREQHRAVIVKSLMLHPRLADREHARRCGVSHPTVSGVRTALEAAGRLESFTSRVGGDGRERPAHNEPTKTSGPADAAIADGPGEDHTEEDANGTAARDASSKPADAEGSVSAGDKTESRASLPSEAADPVDAPEQGGTGVARPAPAADLVNTPIGPMTRDFAEKLDKLVPDPNPHREWQSTFLNNVFAAAKAMRGYSGAEIAEKADDELRAEFARFVGDMESLLHEVSQAQLERAGAKVYKLRSVQ